MSSLLASGIELMLVGMGTVFFFLTVLVGATTLMSKIVLRFAPVQKTDEITPEEVAAITAAIALHRKTD